MKIIAISQRVQKINKYNEFRDQIDNRLNVDVHFSLKNDLTSGEEVSLTYTTGE